MRIIRSFLVSVTVIGIIILAAPKATLAEIHYLVTVDSECPTGTPTPPCHTNFRDAITDAVAGDSIEISPGTYLTENITLNKSVSINGKETARTFLDGNGSGTVLTVDGVTTTMSIKRLTFIRASAGSAGILVRNSSSVKITNNVFQVGENSTGVQATDSPTTEITNNTFYQNLNGILSNTTTLNIINNIFSGNGTAISPSNMDLNGIQNNLFFGGTIGPTNISFDSSDVTNYKGNIKDADPSFVDPDNSDITKRDFHLESGTPCKDKGHSSAGNDTIDGTTADIGAYGGSNSDTIPFPVSGLIVTGVTGTSPATVSISWNANTAYQVGGYFIYYGTAAGVYGTPIDTLSTTASYSIPGLTSTVLSAPTGTLGVGHTIESHTINLDWSSSVIIEATGYEIRYDIAPGVIAPPTEPSSTTILIDAGSAKFYPLQNLENGTTYYFIVTPYAQTIYFIAAKAYYSANKAFISNAFSNEVKAGLNDKIHGSPSVEDSDFPEFIDPYPNLPNEGCFIATAAYGYYSAPQVQALRAFRDRYLISNTPGKAFVRLYYQYGPIGAVFLNTHPWLKPAVRAALVPAVGGALFMTETSLVTKLIVLICIGFLISYMIYNKRKFLSFGGPR